MRFDQIHIVGKEGGRSRFGEVRFSNILLAGLRGYGCRIG